MHRVCIDRLNTEAQKVDFDPETAVPSFGKGQQFLFEPVNKLRNMEYIVCFHFFVAFFLQLDKCIDSKINCTICLTFSRTVGKFPLIKKETKRTIHYFFFSIVDLILVPSSFARLRYRLVFFCLPSFFYRTQCLFCEFLVLFCTCNNILTLNFDTTAAQWSLLFSTGVEVAGRMVLLFIN